MLIVEDEFINKNIIKNTQEVKNSRNNPRVFYFL